MNSSPVIELSAAEQAQLQQLVPKVTASARQLPRAHILQFSHQGQSSEAIGADF